MLSHHSVVWIDHFEAHIIHFNVDSSQDEIVKSQSTHLHFHVKSGSVGNGPAAENARYFNKIVGALQDSIEILLMGPDSGKDEFMKYAEKYNRPISEKIIATLTDDHPTDSQLLAFARKYFVKLDWMNMIPAEVLRRE